MQKHFLIVVNPVPSRARTKVLKQFLIFMQQKSLSYELYPTEAAISANQHYFAHHLHKFTDIVVIGGDGTLHNVINSLPRPFSLPIGLIPAGTGNDFARWLYGLHCHNRPFIFEQVVGNWTSSISLGVCEFENGHQQYFHNVLGLGFDALLAKELKHSKGLFRSLGYMVKAVQHIPFYQTKPLTLNIGDEKRQYHNLITAFANGQYFGAGMQIAPTSSPDNQALTMCRIEKLPKLKMLGQILRLFNGSHIHQDFVDYRDISEVAYIEDTGLDIEADGEYLGQSPCRIYLTKHAAKFKRLL